MTILKRARVATKSAATVLASLSICMGVDARSLFSLSILRIGVITGSRISIAACILALLQLAVPEPVQSQIRSDFTLVDTGYALSVRPDRLHNLHAVCKREDGLYYARYDSLGNELTLPGLIPFTDDFSFSPRLAIAGNRGLIVWEAASILGMNVYIVGQLFTLEGNLVGEPFLINDSLVFGAIRHSPDVIALPDSSYLVVWSGEGEQSMSPLQGIYGQKISAAGVGLGSNFLICGVYVVKVNRTESVCF
jgi:hypothetical protein